MSKNKSSQKYNILQKNISIKHRCAFTSYKKCEDNYIGTVSTKASNLFALVGLRYNNRIEAIRHSPVKGIGHIVIVLESPHVKEFAPNLIAPALGTTGERIHSHLWNMLSNAGLLCDNDSEVYLVNAVQYQCSLGFETGIYRDIIFKKMFNGTELVARIQKYNPTIIIIASTLSTSRDITEFLRKDFSDKLYKASSHPSVWNATSSIERIASE